MNAAPPGTFASGRAISPDGSDWRVLRRASVFAALAERDFREVVGRPRCCMFRRGQSLFIQGDPAAAFFVVLEGWVSLLRDGTDGARTVIKIVGPGESFAEAMLAADARYPVSAEAASAVRVARLETARLRALLCARPELGLSIIAAIFRQLRSLVDQVEHLKSWPIERRLAAMLLQMCDRDAGSCSFDLPVEQAVIAARIAVTPSTLSRTLGKLQAVGVTARRGQVAIRDVDVLIRFVRGGSEPDGAGACSSSR